MTAPGTTAASVWLWARWALLALGLLVYTLAVTCTADSRARKAIAVARAQAADSVATVWESRNRASHDSARSEAIRANGAALAAQMDAAAARLAAEDDSVRATRALRQAAAVRDSAARAGQAVVNALDSLAAALAAAHAHEGRLLAANTRLGVANDSLRAALLTAGRALDTADSTIAAHNRAVSTLAAIKTPSRSLLGTAARITGLVVGEGAIVYASYHVGRASR